MNISSAFIERPIAVRLDRGKVHENIFAGFSLYESEALGRVKPLHCTFFSHCKNLKTEITAEKSPKTARSQTKQGCRSNLLRSPEK